MEIDLSKYEYINIEKLMEISAVREKVLQLIFSDIPEDLVEYMLEPFENILKHHGINLNDETSY